MILVAAIGTGKYQEVEYYRAVDPERVHRTCYGPAAAAALHEGVEEALLLMTPEAEQAHGRAVMGELERLGVRSHRLDIALGRTEAEIWAIVRLLIDSIPPNAEVLVDVTHALRHLPVLMLSALTFLTGEREVRIHAIVYGAFEVRDGARVPMFDLHPFFTLMECYHGVRQFRETGDARRLTEYLKRLNAQLWRQAEGSPPLAALAHALSAVGESLMSGLPLEAGLHSRQALANLEPALARISGRHEIAATLVESMRPALEAFALRGDAKEKADIVLDLAELGRQLRMPWG
jgi:CRISPR-associated DxTHG motif protein